MNRYQRMSLSVLLIVVMMAASFAVLAHPASAAQTLEKGTAPAPQTKQGSLSVDMGSTELASVSVDKKIDAMLQEKMKGSMGPFKVYLLVTDRTSANECLKAQGLPQIQGVQLPGLPTTRVMDLSSTQILALAKNPGVYKIMSYEQPMYDQAPIDRALENTPIDIAKPSTTDFDVDFLHGATAAWADGYMGNGVKVAVIDTGMDMAHPDLLGQQARYDNPASPYFGWPIAYDDRAAFLWSMNMIGGWVADTTATSADLNGNVSFDGRDYNIAGLQDVSGTPVASQSGVYHIGYHTDQNLMSLVGGPVGVLAVDATTPGVYDTVYVDVTDDLNFANDKACTEGDETSYFDFYNSSTGNSDWSRWNGGDGYPDISAGMVYWISDGNNTLPGADWLYGATFAPSSGDAVAFVGEFSLGESHGTMTSSAALGTGASFYGQLTGMAPQAKLIAIPFTGDVVASWLFAELGADGIANTGDEANIVSNSYGYSDQAIGAGYTVFDQYTSLISLMGAKTLWFWATGNGGPGYGTVTAPQDFLAVHCGATTTMQYRYWLGYEEYPQYTTWGDMAPFSNSGPTRTGKLHAEISASGMYSMEPAPLNEGAYGGWGDGYVHFQLGSGTSHATPTVAGGAALGFQAYYQLYTDWPYIDCAKAKLMAAADDMHYDPLKQGAGWLNASTYVKLMGEYGGVESTLGSATEPALMKAALYPGTFDGTSTGTRYENFPNFLLPAEYDDSHYVATTNYDPANDASVSISSKMLMRTGSDRIDWTTLNTSDQWFNIKPMIPIGTDLVKITWFMPFNEFDPETDYVSNCQYWLEVHDWVDTNGDGYLNRTGGEWELYRFTVDGSDCNYNQVTIRDPLDRSHDGLIVRVRSIVGGADLDMSLQLDYYQLQTFDWIQFRVVGDPFWSNTLDVTVPSLSSIEWQVLVTAPLDAYVGTYAAAIYIDDGSRVQDIPVVINVPASDYEFSFGGPSYFDTTYNNDFTGIADKLWRFEVGDWRIYWCLPTAGTPSANADLVVTASWSDLPTDVNVHVLGAVDALNWSTNDAPYGPNLLEVPIADSNEHYMGAGIFGIGTNTGGPSEVIAAPLGQYINMTGPAPFAILTRCAVMDGYAASDTLFGYTSWLTLNGFAPTSVDLGDPFSVPLTDTIYGLYDITVGGGVEARGGGVGPLRSDTYPMEPIYQDAMTGNFVVDLANAAYTRAVQVTPGSSMLSVSTAEVSGAPDIDLGVWYDANMNGVADLSEPYWYVGISGSSESLVLDNPAAGQYLIKVLGYDVTGVPGYFSLNVMMGVPGYIQAYLPDNWVTSGTYELDIEYSVPAETGVYFGLATFGFMGADDMFSIPVTIHVDLTAPTIENLVPAYGDVLGANSVIITFDVVDTGAFSSSINWGNVEVNVDGIWDFYSGSTQMSITPPHVTVSLPVTLSEGTHTIGIWASDNWGNWQYVESQFTVNSVIEKFTAVWIDPTSGLTVPDGATVALNNMTMRGFTDPFATVDVLSAAGTVSTTADNTGFYEASPVDIVSGLNIVTVTTTNDGGVTATMLKMIVSDTYCELIVLETPDVTKDPNLEIMGLTEPGATLWINDVAYMPNPDGSFGIGITLSEGPNVVYVNATDAVGNMNNKTIDVVLDATPPALTILEPTDGSNVNQPSVTVWGTTEAGATVWVNGVVASNGTADWTATVVLSEGMNTIIVTAEDEVGNSVMQTISVEYIPPDYVTPEELAAVQADLMGMIANLTASLADNVTALQGEIDGLSTSLAESVSDLQSQIDALDAALGENVTDLQGQIDALTAQLSADVATLNGLIDALDAAIAANVTAMQGQINGLNSTLQTNVSQLNALITALTATLAQNAANLQNSIAAVQASLAQNVTSLQAEIATQRNDMNAMNNTLHNGLNNLRDDLENELTGLNQTTQNDIGAVDEKAKDTDAFASMLMYLTLILFAIAVMLVGAVWYVMNGKIKGGGSGGSQAMEEVQAEPPSDVEKEFEDLKKEIKQDEL